MKRIAYLIFTHPPRPYRDTGVGKPQFFLVISKIFLEGLCLKLFYTVSYDLDI